MAARKRSKPKRHKDVNFQVWRPKKGVTGRAVFDARFLPYNTFDEAAARAITESVSTGNYKIMIDVLVYSRAGARWWAGDWGVDQYNEDPDRSVFQRIEVRASALGGIS